MSFSGMTLRSQFVISREVSDSEQQHPSWPSGHAVLVGGDRGTVAVGEFFRLSILPRQNSLPAVDWARFETSYFVPESLVSTHSINPHWLVNPYG
jgi:hypothetical protein